MQNSDTTKYIIHAKIKADGVIERPDVIGAIFGQTEGLIGSDLDLREQKKSGRIGRLEVNIKSNMGKSAGTIDIPSSLDKVETAVLAASLETIDRIGPCISNINIVKIEDVRSSKRKQIGERAKQVLTAMLDEMLPESQEIIDEVRQSVRIEEMIIKELLQFADVDFIARAPDGKGVEELVQKEVVKSLRQKIPVEQAFDYYQVSKKRRFAIMEATRKKMGGKTEP